MARVRRSRIDEIAQEVTLGRAIDWEREIASAPESLRSALLRLRQLQTLHHAFRSIDAELDPDRELDPDATGARTASRPPREPSLFRWGHLDVHRLIGRGSFGDVYLATETRLGRQVALKLWRAEAAPSGSSARRFLEEARRLARVGHPNVVIVHGAAVHRGRPGYWTELIAGETLETLLTRRGRLPIEETIRIGLDLTRALGAVHAAGFVHGDVKTENVMRCEDGRTVLMDFGATSRTDSRDTPFLTPAYAAPESLEGAPAHPTADIYALGTLLFRLVAGTYPIEAEDLESLRAARREGRRARLAQLRADLPASFVSVVERALADDPSSRFLTAAEMERSLRHALRHSDGNESVGISVLRETALHGRERELDRLGCAFREASSGNGRVALIVGEAGIGKSRLIDEAITRIAKSRSVEEPATRIGASRSIGDEPAARIDRADEPFRCLYGSYPPGGASTAMSAFLDAFQNLWQGHDARARLHAYFTDAPLLADAILALVEGGDAAPRDTLQTAVVRLTHRLALEMPTVLMIDDLHFAPEQGRALFAAVAASASRHRLLLIGATRPELDASWIAALTRLPFVERIAPDRLERAQVEALLEERLPGPLPAELVSELATRSDGNPYFLLELIRDLEARAQGELPHASAWRTLAIPFTIEQLVAARIDSLQTEEDRELLEVACCAGARFDPLVTAKAARIEPLQALRRLAHIESRHRLVRSQGTEYCFDHHQVQELLYARMAEPLRRHYHSALAEALRSEVGRFPGTPGGGDGAICDHEIRGKEPARALPYLDERLEYLEAQHANESALDLMERALALPEVRGDARASLLTRRARLLSVVGRRAESFSVYREALRTIEPDTHPLLAAEIEASMGVLQHLQGRSNEAVSSLRRSIGHARAAQSAVSEATARRSLGTVLFHQGRKLEAEVELRKSIELSRSAGAVLDVSVAAGFLGEILSEAGRFEEADRWTREAIEEARAHESILAELSPLATLGVLTMNRGRTSEAMDAFRRLRDQSRRIGHRSGESLAWTNMGSLLLTLGRYEEARQTLEQVVRLAPEIQARDHEASAHGDLGCLHGIRGDFERSGAAFEAADALRVEYGLAWFHTGLLLHRGEIEALYGRLETAEAYLREALLLSTESGDPVGRSTAHLHLGRIARARSGMSSIAEGLPGFHLREARRLADEVGAAPESLAAAIEFAFQSEVELADVLVRFEESESRLSFAERMRARFTLFEAGGGSSHLQVAGRMLSETLAGLDEKARRRAIDSIPLYRRIQSACSAA